MGKASRRKRQTSGPENFEAIVAPIAAAIRKLAQAASARLGTDCYVHAALGQALLRDRNCNTRLVAGYAAWRVGPGDGDVISHTPRVPGHLPPGVRGTAYHTWLLHEEADWLVDFTTYQLRIKAAQLDEADGGHTLVQWCPDYLLLPSRSVRTYETVAQAPAAGVAYYEHRPELAERLRKEFVLDEEDLAMARLILANPQVQVFGPNQTG